MSSQNNRELKKLKQITQPLKSRTGWKLTARKSPSPLFVFQGASSRDYWSSRPTNLAAVDTTMMSGRVPYNAATVKPREGGGSQIKRYISNTSPHPSLVAC
jgi:hypothetical protein